MRDAEKNEVTRPGREQPARREARKKKSVRRTDHLFAAVVGFLTGFLTGVQTVQIVETGPRAPLSGAKGSVAATPGDMGVTKLLSYLKPIGGAFVSLEGGSEQAKHVIIDGGFLLHSVASRGNAAYLLVLHNDVTGFVHECARVVRRFEARGVKVTVVFDGDAPPAKKRTGDERRKRRESKASKARSLDDSAAPRQQVNAAAAEGCSFDVRTTALIATRLRLLMKGGVYIAPREADPQIVVLHDGFLEDGADVYVYGTDSDLLVLGVAKLLFKVWETNGELAGRFVNSSWVLNPSGWAFSINTPAHAFLRQLHGLPKQHDPDLVATPLSPPLARQRLLAYALVGGNDFGSFSGIGPVRAAAIALPLIPRPLSEDTPSQVASMACLGYLAERIIAAGRAEDTSAARGRLLDKLRRIDCMFRHPVVWDHIRGGLTHMEELPSIDLSDSVTKHTGQLTIAGFQHCPPPAAGFLLADTDISRGAFFDLYPTSENPRREDYLRMSSCAWITHLHVASHAPLENLLSSNPNIYKHDRTAFDYHVFTGHVFVCSILCRVPSQSRPDAHTSHTRRCPRSA